MLNARFPALLNCAIIAEESSGKDVPIASTKAETINGDNFMFSASFERNLTVKSDDKIKAIMDNAKKVIKSSSSIT